MHIEADVHERFVREFGLNMLNTLTTKEHRLTAHKRRIFVFDERGGVFGGHDGLLEDYQNLTTGVFYSRRREVVGVRYRCRPNDLEAPDLGAFHTHPALYDPSPKKVRTRIDRMLWLSDMDCKAFFKQSEIYNFEWHFIGTIDIGCFHIDDVRKGKKGPREVIRYQDLDVLLERMGPIILWYDQLLTSQATARRSPSVDTLEQLVRNFTARDGALEHLLATHPAHELPGLAQMVANEFQMLGYTARQVSHLVHRAFADDAAQILAFRDYVTAACTRLSALSS